MKRVRLFRRLLSDTFWICLGVGMATIGLKGFLLSNQFLDGGAVGVALLLNAFTHVDVSILIMLVNIPFIFLGFKRLSGVFALKSVLAISALALLVHFVSFNPVTQDKLLIAVFGGVFVGAGIGFAIRGGAVIDGAEVLALSIGHSSGLTVGDFISVFNVCLFSIAAVILNIETAMYSILTYFSAAKMVDFILNGVEEYIGVTIVSEHADTIRRYITLVLHRGVTVYKSESGFGKRALRRKQAQATPEVEFESEDRHVLFCVMTRLEVPKLLPEIQKIDPNVFVIQHGIKSAHGGMLKKRRWLR